jgi:hypothetical protein
MLHQRERFLMRDEHVDNPVLDTWRTAIVTYAREGRGDQGNAEIADFHFQAVDHARHTTKGLSLLWPSPFIRWWRQPGSNR